MDEDRVGEMNADRTREARVHEAFAINLRRKRLQRIAYGIDQKSQSGTTTYRRRGSWVQTERSCLFHGALYPLWTTGLCGFSLVVVLSVNAPSSRCSACDECKGLRPSFRTSPAFSLLLQDQPSSRFDRCVEHIVLAALE